MPLTAFQFYELLGEDGARQAWTPASLSGLALWLKADAITGLSDGDPVATWTDSAGLSNATQAVAGSRPTYKVNIINGKPVVRFDNVDDHLTCVGSADGLKITTAMTAFVVWNPGSLDIDTIFTKGRSSGDVDYIWQVDRSGAAATTQHAWGGGAWRDGSSGGVTASAAQISHLVFNGSSVKFYNNGAAFGTPASAAWSATNDTFFIGYQCDANPLGGDIAELIICKAVLSAADQNQVLRYLALKYGLSVTAVA